MAEMKIANRLRVLRRSGIYLLVIAGMALLFFLQRAPWKIPDDLIETLRNPNAGRLLQERATKDKRLIPSLIGLLKDEGRAILERSLATAILAKIGALSVPLLIECLESENPAVRLKAVMVLQQMGPEARGATAALCRALQDDSLPVQQEAFEALTVIHPDGEALLPALAELLESPRKDVRLDTVAKLSQMGEKATQSLLQGLNDEEPDVREQIVSVLPASSVNSDAAIMGLTKALSDKEVGVRLAAASRILQIDLTSDLVLPVLIDARQHKDETVRRRAAEIIAKLGPQGLLLQLEALKSQDEEIRQQIAWNLENYVSNPEGAISLARVLLTDKNPTVRGGALSGLGSMVERLRGLNSKGTPSRASRLGAWTRDLVPLIVRTLREGDEINYSYAAQALGYLGPDAEETVPMLMESLKAKNSQLRYAAAYALGLIRPGTKESIPEVKREWQKIILLR